MGVEQVMTALRELRAEVKLELEQLLNSQCGGLTHE
jgi:hypothetical protein